MSGNRRLNRPSLRVIMVLFLFALAILTAPAQAAEEPPPFNPPWGPTRERVPQEVKDKENETPLSWCDNPETKQFEVNYIDANTGTRTTIRRQEVPLTPDGKTTKIVWEITTQEPGQPRRKVTYDLEPGNETRRERVGRDKPTTRPVQEGDLFDPAKQPKRSSVDWNLFSTHLANVVASTPLRMQEAPPDEAEVLAATTQTQPSGSVSGLPPARGLKSLASLQPPTINGKIFTYGNPPADALVFRDDPPPVTPNEFASRTPAHTWGPMASDGPSTWKPGEEIRGEIPGGIRVGSGWSWARIPAETVQGCVYGSDDDDEGPWRGDLRFRVGF
ncbi:MAG: hypothetical protein HYV04_14770 [Deltaproteobacteria bacterium]|nr:hypothetical protein [Deltaproteobacteria bacterium]